MRDVKKKIDVRGTMFEGRKDEKQVKIEDLLYQVLQRGRNKAAAHAQGKLAITLNHDYLISTNPDDH